MANLLTRLGRGVTQLPRKLLAAAGWAHMEPTGLGVGPVHTGDLDEIEAERRRRHETWRRPDDEEPRSGSN
jgi:hypothetical protein